MKKVLAVGLSGIIALSLAGCGGSSSSGSSGSTPGSGGDGGVIKIAVAAPMTGDNSEYGIGYSNAVKLMAQKYNDNGGLTIG